MKSSHAVLAAAFLVATAAVLTAPASSAAAYHSFTWDSLYGYEGIEVSTNAGDNSRIPDGYPLEISIRSDVYDASVLDVYIKDSAGDTVQAHISESGLYCLDVTDDLVLVLKNFVKLPAGGTDPLTDPADVTSPGTVEPPEDVPEDPKVTDPYVPAAAAGYTWDEEALTGLLLAVSVFAAAAVLIYGVFAAASRGEYYGKP